MLHFQVLFLPIELTICILYLQLTMSRIDAKQVFFLLASIRFIN